MLAAEGGELFLQKVSKFYQKKVYKAMKIQRKPYTAYENRKLAGVMQAIVAADGALEAKCARESRHRPFSKGPRSEQIAIRTSKQMTRASINNKKGFFLRSFGGQTNDRFDRKC